MALTLLRRRGILPLRPQAERAPRRTRDPIGPVGPRDDDYLVEGEELSDQPTVAARVIHTLQIVLIILTAILSLGIVWLMGVVFNVF